MTSTVSLFEVDPNKDVSYVNITLLDASKTIETTVKEKLKEMNDKIRFPMVRKILAKECVQDKIASTAGKKVKPSTVAKELSKQMPKILMYMIDQKVGMTIAARTVFVEETYVVIEFQVKYVDTRKFYDKMKEGPPDIETMEMEMVPPEVLDAWMKEQEELPPLPRGAEGSSSSGGGDCNVNDNNANNNGGTQSWSEWLVSPLNYFQESLAESLGSVQKSLESKTLPPVVQSKITEQMGAIMETKLAQKHLEAKIAVLPGESQARYFYSNLEAIREQKNDTDNSQFVRSFSCS
jgi:hypothetical protein